ncbi:carbon-nitrogen hydrolase family protein [Sphingomonas sp. AR_OL41]|uniref:carbon-nitrogen hydrolase family protein n=1 Tax=Sphingomonas sp. AR_OL41 TaxID=3042729 RepID=UPI002480F007|nr:carbon-nitrogen hydrolase family protein [Sphingomonas sp. AR_OL41]MDH7975047.1 carbon-nitrogen hydrolase family protein [Sphingomonas sp. AR_OL41]
MRLAVFQRRPIMGDPERAATIIADDLSWASKQSVDLALFPEGVLTGHSYDPATIAAVAIKRDGPELRTLLGQLAPGHPAAIVGAFERRGGAIFNSAFAIEEGAVTGRYAKAHPNEPGVTAGDDCPVFVRAGLTYGINICADANHPATAQRLADAGARLICYPLNNWLPIATADRWRERSIANLQARARQTGCWVASADVTGTGEGVISHGCTMIVATDGAIVARVAEGQEGVAVFDMRLRKLRRSPPERSAPLHRVRRYGHLPICRSRARRSGGRSRGEITRAPYPDPRRRLGHGGCHNGNPSICRRRTRL